MVVSPAGRIFQVTGPSRKDIAKLTKAFDGATSHSLGLKQSTEPADQTQTNADASTAAATALRRKQKLCVRRLADVTESSLQKKKCRVS
jgi:hypothetical protein